MPIAGGAPTALVSGGPFVEINGITFVDGALYVTDTGNFVDKSGWNDGPGAIYRVDLADPCPEDVTGDGAVDMQDLIAVILGWGLCKGECLGDLTGDGAVNMQDLVAVILAWGPCGN